MSQYGAYGAARRGLGYRSILRFYYPGTSWGTARGRIRVLLTADRSPDLVVGTAPGLVVHDLGSGATYRLPRLAGVTRWRLEPVGTRTAVEYLRRGWHRYRTGGRPTLRGEGQFGADRPLTLWTPAGHHDYRGGLRAAAPTRGSRTRDTVNVVALDDYVRGVVPAEMPPGWSLEAVKAQAVAARTYAAWSRARSSGRGWQVCDTSACQVYRGVDGEAGRSDAAVAATAARVLTYRGAAAFTQFSSSSGGWTARGSRPYLAARPDPYDAFAANPVHTWTLRLSAARIQRAFPAVGRLVRLVVTRRDRHGQWGGRVGSIVVDGRRRNVTVSGDRFRFALGLRSTWFVP
jgi:SpoIID/LytB domain protein